MPSAESKLNYSVFNDPWFVRALKVHGLPLILLAVIGIGIWKMIGWGADKFEKLAEPIVAEHIELVRSLKTQAENQTRALSEIGSVIKETNEEIRGNLQKNGELIKTLIDAQERSKNDDDSKS